jgi:hypothetical protein
MNAAATEPLIGVINAGSSSLKFSFYEGERRILSGQVDGIGAHPSASAIGSNGEKLEPPDLGAKPPTVPSEVLPAILPWARKQLSDRRLDALGHRVVHGGIRYSRPAHVTADLLAELEALVPLAPLHEPYNLAPIKMALSLNPELPQVACFDTAFHRTAPEVDQAFALPYSFFEEGIRRYGFHGLSYEYIGSVLPERAPEIANGRVVVAHLGNGCSACGWAPVAASSMPASCCISFSRRGCRPMRCWISSISALACSGFPVFRRTFESSWPAIILARVLRLTYFAIESPAISPRSRPRSAASTELCSRPGLARMQHRCELRFVRLVSGWG